MIKPFKCPQCGFSDYVIELRGCSIQGATVQQHYLWDEEAVDYIFGGNLVVETEHVEHDGGRATCMGCEADVTAAVNAYTQSQPGSGNGKARRG